MSLVLACVGNFLGGVVEKVAELWRDGRGLDAELEIEIETDYKAGKKGMYNIDYYGTDINGYTGHTRLIAVVE